MPSHRVDFSDERGFSLVELMTALAVVAILMVIGLASYAQTARIADDKSTQLDLLTAAKVQALAHLETGEFTSDVQELFDLEPILRYSSDGEPPGTLVVRTEDDRLDTDVCVFAQTNQGDWFAIYHSVLVGDLYGESAPVPCTPGDVASWSSDSW